MSTWESFEGGLLAYVEVLHRMFCEVSINMIQLGTKGKMILNHA